MNNINKNKYIYKFQQGLADGDGTMYELLGTKGANLAEMCNLNIPVPPGFTVTTAIYQYYIKYKGFPADIGSQLLDGIAYCEHIVGKSFGHAENPLLFSIRAGAGVPMPGILSSVLNIGLTDITVQGLALSSGDEYFAWDSYYRFVKMYGNIVYGIAEDLFESKIEERRFKQGYSRKTKLKLIDLKELVADFKEVFITNGFIFPQDPVEQLWGGMKAVFDSWNSIQAGVYRQHHDVSADIGTAVNFQCMVFGNKHERSCIGNCFTRDPTTGENTLYGEYLPNAQGEEIIDGKHILYPISNSRKHLYQHSIKSFEDTYPILHDQLFKISKILELSFKEIQEIEFTVERDKLWILQSQKGTRTIQAAIKIALDLLKEGTITPKCVVSYLNYTPTDRIRIPQLDIRGAGNPITIGIPTSPGGVSGKVFFNKQEIMSVIKTAKHKEKFILITDTIIPEDLDVIYAIDGLVTLTGGVASHGAMISKSLDQPAIGNAEQIDIHYTYEYCKINDTKIKKGEVITIDGTRGGIYIGKKETITPDLDENFIELMLLIKDICFDKDEQL